MKRNINEDAETISREKAMKNAVLKRRHRRFRFNLGLAVLILVFAVVFAVCMIALRPGGSGNPDAPTTDSDTVSYTNIGGADTAQVTVSEAGFVPLEVPNSQMRCGDLILVNYENPYTFPEDNDIKSVFGNKSKSYKVNNATTSMSLHVTDRFNRIMDDFYSATGCGDVMIVSGYRSYEDQERIYRDRVERDGAEEAAKYVANPGESEHHTGLAMDLTVYLNDGSSYYLADYPACDWFEENAAEYGFVLRYPEEKKDITRISYESWHYRYVGTPHSQIMTEKGMCFEEYIEFLKGYRAGERYLVYSNARGSSESTVFPEDASAVIYYVPAQSGEKTKLFVPEGKTYEISGNNSDGFIVTVR